MYPPLHESPQVVPLHVAVPFVSVGHGEHEVPQELTLVSRTHCPPHMCVPGSHAMPQLDPLQVATALLAVGHAEHEEPHESTLSFGRQEPPHRCDPWSHATPHVPPLQTAMPPETPGQVVPQPPQLLVSEPCVSTHELPQRVRPGAHPLAHAPFEQTGVTPPHSWPHMPQLLAELERLASHPFDALMSQSA